MAKKSISANAEKIGANDRQPNDRQIKYISDYAEYHFIIRALDESGNPVFHTDANGNGKLPTIKEFHFAPIRATKDHKSGKIDPNTAYSIFIADPDVHGADFKQIVEALEKLRANPMNKLYSADDHFKRRNAEAYKIAKEKTELEEKLSAKNARIEELEKKLGLRKN